MSITITTAAAHKRISIQKNSVPELLRKYKPTSAEQGMHIAFKIAHKCIDECPKAKPHWRDAKQESPKNNGLFLVTVIMPDGIPRTRTAFFVDGKWENKLDVTHWTLMPQPYKEVV